MQILRGDGWVCSRSAMSHGPVDLFAAKKGQVLLVQVKSGTGRMSKEELIKFIEWGKAFRARSEIWYFKGRKGLTKKRAYTPRIKLGTKKP